MGRRPQRCRGLHRAENHRHRGHGRSGGRRRRVDTSARRRRRGCQATERTAAHTGLRRAESRLPPAHARLRRPATYRTGTCRPPGAGRQLGYGVVGDTITERFVDSVDGERIAVYEQGNPDGPTLVMTHGWPDSHVLWDGVVPRVADRFRIICFDNRGVGKSSVPNPVSAYTVAKLADDLGTVIDTVSPGEPVHILGHDWGSVATWEYLTRPGASDRVASFTSAS